MGFEQEQRFEHNSELEIPVSESWRSVVQDGVPGSDKVASYQDIKGAAIIVPPGRESGRG